MIMPPKIWVLAIDYGTEGLREPMMAFPDEETAKRAQALVESNPSATRTKLLEVPMWHR